MLVLFIQMGEQSRSLRTALASQHKTRPQNEFHVTSRDLDSAWETKRAKAAAAREAANILEHWRGGLLIFLERKTHLCMNDFHVPPDELRGE